MLEDDNGALNKKLQLALGENAAMAEERHQENLMYKRMDEQMKTRLRQRKKFYSHLTTELENAAEQFQSADTALQTMQTEAENRLRQAGANPSGKLVQDQCKGVTIPEGFSYAPKGRGPIFPQDLAADSTGLHSLLKADAKFAGLEKLTTCLESKGALSQPSYPWGLWTWLGAISTNPSAASSNFTEWGLGAGGTSMFLGRLAALSGGSLAGLDAFGQKGQQKERQLRDTAQQCNLSMDAETKLHDLSSPAITWPEAGTKEKIGFTHIASKDYSTTLGVLDAVYAKTVDRGILAIDNFFGASGETRRAIKDFFTAHTPGKSPLIYPVFPGSSVVIFKGQFANSTHRRNRLDGNFYAFDLIKGRPEIIAAVSKSATELYDVNLNATKDSNVDQVSLCWLSLAMQRVSDLRDFVSTPEHVSKDFDDKELFQFMSSSFNDKLR